jgi:hypothetical protein
MNKLLRIAALVTVWSTGSAHAIESFSVPYGGVATIPIDCHVQPLSCGIVTFPWQSVVTVQTVSGADGVYTFNSFPPNDPSNTLTFMSLVRTSRRHRLSSFLTCRHLTSICSAASRQPSRADVSLHWTV